MNILTFDLEDWFHLLDNPSTKTEKEWNNFESRFSQNTDRILELLSDNNQKATFFCLGWICRKYPEIVKRISNQGYDLGCHSLMHQLVYEQNEESFENDLVGAVHVIEDLTGKKVTSYRAPGFSINKNTLWALRILMEQGILYDSSIFPASRSHGGFSEIPYSSPFIFSIKDKKLLELPISTVSFLRRRIVFSGGGYFRLFPYPIIKKLTGQSPYIMSYFHPRDFDPDQPVIPGLSPTRRFKSYYGLNGGLPKLTKWIKDYSFTDIPSAIKQIDMNSLETVTFPNNGQ
jgi:peptidoglycan-N-acetylglucosamine deacetylase